MRTALTTDCSRPADAPRICYRRWGWILGVGLVLVNGGYVLSWPVVTELTYYASTEQFDDPQTGQLVMGVTIRSPALVEWIYLPLVELAYEYEVPLLSPALRTYETVCVLVVEPITGTID